MINYTAILRGINVSGKNKLKMQDLRESLSDLPFLRTYIQSGNLVFKYPETENNKLAHMISEKIRRNFGLEVAVLVLKEPELLKIIENNPLKNASNEDLRFIGVTFLFDIPKSGSYNEIEDKKRPGESIYFTPQAIYMHCPEGFARTKLTNTLVEKKLQVTATSRNLKTVNQLKIMMQDLE